MWLDNPISIASGREVYGYPKSWGCIASDPPTAIGDLPEANDGTAGAPAEGLPSPPHRLDLEAFGIEQYGAGEAPRCRPLLELVRLGGNAAGALRQNGGFDTLVRECGARLGAEATLPLQGRTRGWLHRKGISPRLLENELADRTVSQFFLKQSRSPERSDRASWQEIVRAPATRIKCFRWGLLPPYRLRVHDLDSHPLSRELDGGEPGALRLGLLADQQIDLGFVARFDFRVELGEVVWRSRSRD